VTEFTGLGCSGRPVEPPGGTASGVGSRRNNKGNKMNIGKLEVSLPSDNEIRVARVFDASPQLVFDAHTKPELVKRWLLGPPGWEMPGCDIDLKVGGKFRYVWRAADGSSEFAISGEFREMAEPHLIVHTEVFEGDPNGGEALITSRFDAKGAGTLHTMVMRFPSKEARDGALATGMTDGMETSYARLDEILTEA